jgi:hypothetical protein
MKVRLVVSRRKRDESFPANWERVNMIIRKTSRAIQVEEAFDRKIHDHNILAIAQIYALPNPYLNLRDRIATTILSAWQWEVGRGTSFPKRDWERPPTHQATQIALIRGYPTRPLKAGIKTSTIQALTQQLQNLAQSEA